MNIDTTLTAASEADAGLLEVQIDEESFFTSAFASPLTYPLCPLVKTFKQV